MYCIAILTDQEQEGQDSAEYIRNYFKEKHIFPLIEIYQNQEQFFAWTLKTVPTVVLLALSGVSGLNVAEHLRSLYRFPVQAVLRLGNSAKEHHNRYFV